MFTENKNQSVLDTGAWDSTDAIKSLRPDAAFQYYEGSFLQYFDPHLQRPPTHQEIEVEITRLKSEAYKLQRKLEYPSLEDFVDAYYWKENGDESLMKGWLKSVKTIKNKYPKF
jgi:hypothetical protein